MYITTEDVFHKDMVDIDFPELPPQPPKEFVQAGFHTRESKASRLRQIEWQLQAAEYYRIKNYLEKVNVD